MFSAELKPSFIATQFRKTVPSFIPSISISVKSLNTSRIIGTIILAIWNHFPTFSKSYSLALSRCTIYKYWIRATKNELQAIMQWLTLDGWNTRFTNHSCWAKPMAKFVACLTTWNTLNKLNERWPNSNTSAWWVLSRCSYDPGAYFISPLAVYFEISSWSLIQQKSESVRGKNQILSTRL